MGGVNRIPCQKDIKNSRRLIVNLLRLAGGASDSYSNPPSCLTTSEVLCVHQLPLFCSLCLTYQHPVFFALCLTCAASSWCVNFQMAQILTAVHARGRQINAEVKTMLGHDPSVDIIGFIYIGTPTQEPKPRNRPDLETVVSEWSGPAA